MMILKKIKPLAPVFFLFALLSSCEEDEPVRVGNLPVANFTVQPEYPVIGTPTYFTDTSESENDSINYWLWNFEDGTVSLEQHPEHVFEHATTFKVRLTIKNSQGGENTVQKSISVSDPEAPNIPPTPSFAHHTEIDPLESSATVIFNDASTDSDGSIVSWEWDFGDETTSTTQNPSHSYEAFGTYEVTLRVTDDSGAETVLSQEIYTGEIKWTYTTGGSIKRGTPAMDQNGTLYIGSDDDHLHAISAEGIEKWTFQTKGNIQNAPTISPDETTLYIGSDDDSIYALSLVDGSKKWSIDTGGNVNLTCNALGADGTLYIGNEGSSDSSGAIFAIHSDGTKKWSHTSRGDVLSMVLTDTALYFTHNNDEAKNERFLICLKPETGEKIWEFEHGSFSAGSMAIDAEKTVYFQGDFGNNEGKIWAIDSNGDEKWSTDVYGSASRGGIVLADNGSLYVTTKESESNLKALDRNTGSAIWTFTAQDDFSAAAAVDNAGNVYVGNFDGSFYVLDANGKLTFKFNAGTKIWSSATIDDNGVVYFGGYDGNLYALKFSSNGLNTGEWPKLGNDLRNTNRN